jgi:hypothetical protein
VNGTTDERPREGDYPPHRAGLLFGLAMASWVLGVLSAGSLLPSVLGLPLGVTAWLMARYDLARMRAGLLDPLRQRPTEVALGHARSGMMGNGVCLVVLLVLLAVFLLGRP